MNRRRDQTYEEMNHERKAKRILYHDMLVPHREFRERMKRMDGSAKFLEAFKITYDHEGGGQLTDTNDDRGGETFAGISRVHHPDWSGWEVLDRGNLPSEKDVADFYRERYWEPAGLEACNSQHLANFMFDTCVHIGVPNGVKLFQRCVPELTDDGVAGPLTRGFLSTATPGALIAQLVAHRLNYYMRVIHLHPKQAKFAKGWSWRAMSYLEVR